MRTRQCCFFPEAKQCEARAFIDAHSWAETMAEFQGLLLEHMDSPLAGQIKRQSPQLPMCTAGKEEEAVPVLR